jgi:C4-type Zn-finger protein
MDAFAVSEAKLSKTEGILARVVDALENVIEEYDLFRKDEYERGLAPLDDEIHDARTTLAEIKGESHEALPDLR